MNGVSPKYTEVSTLPLVFAQDPVRFSRCWKGLRNRETGSFRENVVGWVPTHMSYTRLLTCMKPYQAAAAEDGGGSQAVLTHEQPLSRCPVLRGCLMQWPLHKGASGQAPLMQSVSTGIQFVLPVKASHCLPPLSFLNAHPYFSTECESLVFNYTFCNILWERFPSVLISLLKILVSYKTKTSFLKLQRFFHFPTNSDFEAIPTFTTLPCPWLQKYEKRQYLCYHLNRG